MPQKILSKNYQLLMATSKIKFVFLHDLVKSQREMEFIKKQYQEMKHIST